MGKAPTRAKQAMPHRLPIGIIGLGRRWRRYRPALAGLRRRLAVRAVCDQRPDRAARTARELGCDAAAGPTDLLDRDDVKAVLLLDAQWFGLWPVGQAARLGKPVFCAAPLSGDDAHADEIVRRVHAAALPAMAASGPALAPALTRLRDLLATRLGAPRLVRCDWCGPDRTAGTPGIHVLPGLTAACADLLGGEPRSVSATAAEAARFLGVLLQFGDGKAAQLNLWTGTGVRPARRFQAVTDAGDATAELPGTLRWRDGEGSHTIHAPRRPLPRLLLERFLDALAAGAPPEPGFADAYRALLWARAARRSLAEGRRVDIDADPRDMKTG